MFSLFLVSIHLKGPPTIFQYIAKKPFPALLAFNTKKLKKGKLGENSEFDSYSVQKSKFDCPPLITDWLTHPPEKIFSPDGKTRNFENE